MNNPDDKADELVANRILLAVFVVAAASVFWLLVAEKAGVGDADSVGPKVLIALIGITAVVADRIYVGLKRRK